MTILKKLLAEDAQKAIHFSIVHSGVARQLQEVSSLLDDLLS